MDNQKKQTPSAFERRDFLKVGTAATGRPSRWYKDSGSGTLDMREAVFYVLSQPVSTIIIGCNSIAQLEQNVQLASEFNPLNEQQLASLVNRAEPIYRQALFFRRWG